jgi:hypothetical protein
VTMLPPSGRPKKTWQQLRDVLDKYAVRLDHPVVFGWRGYFLDSMGLKGKNDRAVYDDACFLWSPNEGQSVGYNFNTDPSRFRKGYGTAESTKGMALLTTGVWCYKLGLHKGEYKALVQADPVTVIRDGDPSYQDHGWFGINIHRGGQWTTSSLGCQTVPPSQWADFIMTVEQYMKEAGKKRINYVLIERQG